jgi:hypothetical protein
MPGIILLVWTATCLESARRWLAIAGYFLVACVALQQTLAKHRPGNRLVQLPAGKTLLSSEKYEQYSWIIDHTKPGDYFLATSWPGVYFPLDLRSPIFAEMLLSNDWTRPEYVESAIRQVDDRRVRYILWSKRLDSPDDPSRPWEDHLGPFRTYLRSRYRPLKAFSNGDLIWERN